MRFVRAIEELHEDEQNENHAEADENYAGLAQFSVIEIHEREHSGDAEKHADDLAEEEGIAAAAEFVGDYCRGAEDHHRAEQAESQGYSEEFAIGLEDSGHVISVSSLTGLA